MPLGREVTGSRATSRTTIENSRAPRRGIAGVVDRLARSEWKALAATAWPALACLLPACAHGDPVETKLTPAVSVSFDVAGSSVAIDGDTAIVGAPTFQVEGNVGSAFVFTRNADVWGEQDELIAADGAEADLVGSSVSVDGDTAVLGAPGQRLSVATAGAAYVFTRSGATWTEQDKLVPLDAVNSDLFGAAVAVAGDTIIVGDPDQDIGGIIDTGAAYVFTRSGNSWTQQDKLSATTGPLGRFGTSVALSGNTAVVGAPSNGIAGPGAVYVFVEASGVWSLQGTLSAADGAAGDRFGDSVAISGDTVIVGARGDDVAGTDSGSAYVFVRAGNLWSEQDKLVPTAGAPADNFGNAVSVAGNTAVIGAPDFTVASAGAAYVFTRNGARWSETATLMPSDGALADLFGNSVGVSGNTAIVGAPSDDDNGSASGSAYVYAPLPAEPPATEPVAVPQPVIAVIATALLLLAAGLRLSPRFA